MTDEEYRQFYLNVIEQYRQFLSNKILKEEKKCILHEEHYTIRNKFSKELKNKIELI